MKDLSQGQTSFIWNKKQNYVYNLRYRSHATLGQGHWDFYKIISVHIIIHLGLINVWRTKIKTIEGLGSPISFTILTWKPQMVKNVKIGLANFFKRVIQTLVTTHNQTFGFTVLSGRDNSNAETMFLIIPFKAPLPGLQPFPHISSSLHCGHKCALKQKCENEHFKCCVKPILIGLGSRCLLHELNRAVR